MEPDKKMKYHNQRIISMRAELIHLLKKDMWRVLSERLHLVYDYRHVFGQQFDIFETDK